MTAIQSASEVQQFDALTVPLDSGVTLVEASAGTGKTFAITRLVLRLLLERKVESLSQILVVTFTEKATQELVTRIRAVLRLADAVWSATPPTRDARNEDVFTLRERHGDDGALIIARALASLDDLGVSTIHGFCQRMLAESALETRMPFRSTLIEDETEPLIRAAMDWTRSRLLTSPDFARRIVNGNAPLDLMINRFVVPFRRAADTALALDDANPAQTLVADFIRSVDRTFTREKDHRHLIGFDDLLRTLSDVLIREGPDGPLAQRIRTRYRAALIDEFQDTDQTQFPIFSNAFHGCPLFLIGDPKQSIYRFRGADIGAYLAAAKQAGRRYTLEQNYRSTPAYVSAVAQLFTRAEDPFRYPEAQIGFPAVSAATTPEPPGSLATDGRGALVWWWLDKSLGKTGKSVSKDDATRLVVRETANEIVRLLDGGMASRCIAVLLRTNSEAVQVKEALDAAGVPAVISGADDVLASDEASELVRIAAAIAAPFDRRAVSVALATRLWGSSAAEISAAVSDGGESDWGDITDQFASLRDTWRTRGVSAAMADLLASRRSAERLLSLPDGERRMTNVRHVVELLHEASAVDGVSLEAIGTWVARERSVTNTPGRRELRLETDSEAVQILTIHKAKGLEFDVVFCPTLWQAFGNKKGPLGITAVAGEDAVGRRVLDLGSLLQPDRLARAAAEESAEGQRLAYVAMTRAVHRCYVVHGDIGTGDSAASNAALGHLLRHETMSAREVISELVAASGGGMTLKEIVTGAPRATSTACAPAAITPVMSTLSIAPTQLETWRINSFTGLVADDPSETPRDVADASFDPVTSEAPIAPVVTTGFRTFPAGKTAGIALHELFEWLDFPSYAAPATRTLAERSLERFGLRGDASKAARRLDDVMAMVERVCESVVPGTDFALRDVPADATLREWRFDMSVSTTSIRRIADALAAHGSPHAKAYAPQLRTLRDSSLGGYLGGVIDLIFEHEGRWWIADWKSNQLGASDSQYSPDALGAVMMHAHYTLQYHLYMLALHRFLRVRVRDYDPATHWGGVAYVFLRGVRPGTGDGWFVDAPTPALLDALDAALGRRM